MPLGCEVAADQVLLGTHLAFPRTNQCGCGILSNASPCPRFRSVSVERADVPREAGYSEVRSRAELDRQLTMVTK